MFEQAVPAGNEIISRVRGYGVAAIAVTAAVLLNLFLHPLIQTSAFSLFVAAVMISGWYGGIGPGLMATTAAVIVMDLVFLSVGAASWNIQTDVRLLVFALVGALITWLTGIRKRSEGALREAQTELEERVRQRTEELMERNRELWRLQSEIKRVEPLAALGRITGTIAHELGSPLNSVLGYAELLAQEPLTENGRRRLAIIKAQIQRMTEIINNHLTNVRSSSRKREAVDIRKLVEETLVTMAPIFIQHHVKAVNKCAVPLPVVVAHRPSLQRVLVNLIDNALDAMNGGGTVTISCEKSAGGVAVTISDTGAGIPAEILPKIFDIFFSTKAPGQGTGLGLAICQEIVNAHGGTLRVESAVGAGTQVRIFLPTEASHAVVAAGGAA
jgi:signal transduction histidine kinase